VIDLTNKLNRINEYVNPVDERCFNTTLNKLSHLEDSLELVKALYSSTWHKVMLGDQPNHDELVDLLPNEPRLFHIWAMSEDDTIDGTVFILDDSLLYDELVLLRSELVTNKPARVYAECKETNEVYYL